MPDTTPRHRHNPPQHPEFLRDGFRSLVNQFNRVGVEYPGRGIRRLANGCMHDLTPRQARIVAACLLAAADYAEEQR